MHRVAAFAATMRVRATGPALAVAAASLLPAPLSLEVAPLAPRPPPDRSRKGTISVTDSPLLGTLVDTHSPARLALSDDSPTAARFETLLADPVLHSTHTLDPALLGLARSLARNHPLARVEVVSGFRSPKLNEALRKKGHHVASHSQHSVGHALDLRIVPDGEAVPLDPLALSKEIRALGWHGGVGIYLQVNDRFVHADVGPERTWYGQ